MKTFSCDWTAGAVLYHKHYDAASSTMLSHPGGRQILGLFNCPVIRFEKADPPRAHNLVDAWQSRRSELSQNITESLVV